VQPIYSIILLIVIIFRIYIDAIGFYINRYLHLQFDSNESVCLNLILTKTLFHKSIIQHSSCL